MLFIVLYKGIHYFNTHISFFKFNLNKYFSEIKMIILQILLY